MVQNLGLQAIEAATGQEALLCLEEQRVDLLFVGAETGNEIGGLELADRALQRYPHACVLFTTGHARKAMPAPARYAHCGAWITKPYSKAELGQVIARLLRQTR